jgi:hypothetical protein
MDYPPFTESHLRRRLSNILFGHGAVIQRAWDIIAVGKFVLQSRESLKGSVGLDPCDALCPASASPLLCMSRVSASFHRL